MWYIVLAVVMCGGTFFIVLNAARIEINVASPSTFSRTFAEKKTHPIECMKN
jgi:hypothetical protein